MTQAPQADPLDAAFSAPKSGDSLSSEQLSDLLGKPVPAAHLARTTAPETPTEAAFDGAPEPNDVLSAQLDAAFSAPKAGAAVEGAPSEPDHSGPPAAFRPLFPDYTPGEAVKIADTLTEPQIAANAKRRGKTLTLGVMLAVVAALVWFLSQLNLFALLNG